MGGKGLSTFDGNTAVALLFWWVPLVAAALFTYLATALPKGPASARAPSRAQRAWKQVCVCG
jgi:hypothetical protein